MPRRKPTTRAAPPPANPRRHPPRQPREPLRHAVPTSRHPPHRPHPITKALRLSSLIFFRRRREWKEYQDKQTHRCDQSAITNSLYFRGLFLLELSGQRELPLGPFRAVALCDRPEN